MQRRITITTLVITAVLIGGFAVRLPAQAPASSVSGAIPSSSARVLTVAGRSSAFPSVDARGSFVAVAWGATREGASDVMVAVSRDGGRTFGTPVRASDDATRASLGGEQPPRVVVLPARASSGEASRDLGVAVVWSMKTPGGTRLMQARSADGGRSFGRPALVTGTDAPGNRGWHSVTTDAQGRVVVVWLDHRALATPASGTAGAAHEHDHAAMQAAGAGAAGSGDSAARTAASVARAQQSKLYVAVADDPSSVRAVADGVCYCCRTSVTTMDDGGIVAAWRHVYAGNFRDIALTISRDRGRTFSAPARVSEDGWSIDGCPENGPTVVTQGARIHVIWPTVVSVPGREPEMRLFHASSTDGLHFTARQQVPTVGTPRHVQATLVGSSLALAWDEEANGSRRVAAATGTTAADGTVRFTRRVVADDARHSYPVIATTTDGAIVAWASGPSAESTVRVARLPR